jgi:S1-C subfamily serine protease
VTRPYRIVLFVSLSFVLASCSGGMPNKLLFEQHSGDKITLTFQSWFKEETKHAAMRNRAKEICQNEVYSLSNIVSKPYVWGVRGPSRISAVVTCGATSPPKIVDNKNHRISPSPNMVSKIKPINPPRAVGRKPSPKAAIKPKRKPNPSSKSSTSGSGFFVSKLGHIVTNQHVVKACKRITVGDNSNSQVQATVIETDRRNDLALLKISSTEMASDETKSLILKLGSSITSNLGLKVVPLSSNGLLRSDDVELGETLLVAGYPYGEIFSNAIKVTGGMVSAIRGIGDDTSQFQMDAAVQPGNSGGPIYDENGNIVGVVVAQLNKLKMAKTIGSLPENVNFGIKASTVRSFLTSSGLPTKWSSRSKSMSTKDLAKIAKNQTVMVVCHR